MMQINLSIRNWDCYNQVHHATITASKVKYGSVFDKVILDISSQFNRHWVPGHHLRILHYKISQFLYSGKYLAFVPFGIVNSIFDISSSLILLVCKNSTINLNQDSCNSGICPLSSKTAVFPLLKNNISLGTLIISLPFRIIAEKPMLTQGLKSRRNKACLLDSACVLSSLGIYHPCKNCSMKVW